MNVPCHFLELQRVQKRWHGEETHGRRAATTSRKPRRTAPGTPSADVPRAPGPKWPWVNIQIVPPVNIPIPTEKAKMGAAPNLNMVPLVLTHSRMNFEPFGGAYYESEYYPRRVI